MLIEELLRLRSHESILESFRNPFRGTPRQLDKITALHEVANATRAMQVPRLAEVASSGELAATSTGARIYVLARDPSKTARLFVEDIARLGRISALPSERERYQYSRVLEPFDNALLATLSWLSSNEAASLSRRRSLVFYIQEWASIELEPIQFQPSLGLVLGAFVGSALSIRGARARLLERPLSQALESAGHRLDRHWVSELVEAGGRIVLESDAR